MRDEHRRTMIAAQIRFDLMGLDYQGDFIKRCSSFHFNWPKPHFTTLLKYTFTMTYTTFIFPPPFSYMIMK
jgi:hypothetical protein